MANQYRIPPDMVDDFNACVEKVKEVFVECNIPLHLQPTLILNVYWHYEVESINNLVKQGTVPAVAINMGLQNCANFFNETERRLQVELSKYHCPINIKH